MRQGELDRPVKIYDAADEGSLPLVPDDPFAFFVRGRG
jgi:hypothetical protein